MKKIVKSIYNRQIKWLTNNEGHGCIYWNNIQPKYCWINGIDRKNLGMYNKYYTKPVHIDERVNSTK